MLTDITVEHHRNGVSGRGFYAVTFECPENGPMVAAVFPNGEDEDGLPTFNMDEPEIAVFHLGLLGDGNIRFGENSWRGDHYHRELTEAIRQNCKERLT